MTDEEQMSAQSFSSAEATGFPAVLTSPVEGVVVVVDIRSSTKIIETLRSDTLPYQEVLTKLKRYLLERLRDDELALHKFLGDGWILLFLNTPPDSGGKILALLKDLVEVYTREFHALLAPRISKTISPGMTVGIDCGQFGVMQMNEYPEFVGYPWVMAKRLQEEAKASESSSTMLISEAAYAKYFAACGVLAQLEHREFRNVQDGESIGCYRIDLD